MNRFIRGFSQTSHLSLLLAHLSMYPSPSPSHAWNSFRMRSSSQMEPVSLSASAVCDIFSLEAALGRLATNGRHRYSRRSVAAAVVRLAPHLLAIARRIACRILIRARAKGSMSSSPPPLSLPTRVYLATRDDACRSRDRRRGMIASRYRDSSSPSIVSLEWEKNRYILSQGVIQYLPHYVGK